MTAELESLSKTSSVSVSFPADQLSLIDAVAKKYGMSRSAFIQFAVSEVYQDLEDETDYAIAKSLASSKKKGGKK